MQLPRAKNGSATSIERRRTAVVRIRQFPFRVTSEFLPLACYEIKVRKKTIKSDISLKLVPFLASALADNANVPPTRGISDYRDTAAEPPTNLLREIFESIASPCWEGICAEVLVVLLSNTRARQLYENALPSSNNGLLLHAPPTLC